MAYRPESLDKLVGCEDIKQTIRVAIRASQVRNDAFPHTLLYAGPGLGKCLGRDTQILMYDGSIKLVQDVIVGDLLMGDDSSPRRVLSLARGREEMYKVESTKGDSYEVNRSHILSLKQSGDKYGRKNGQIVDISVSEYISLGKNKMERLKGYKVGIEFEKQELTIDPYLIGCWLGDGISSGPEITNTDSEILSYISNKIKEYGLILTKKSKINKDNISYGLRKRFKRVGVNIFTDTLRNLNLINNKHIPSIYKINSRDNRLRLLAGIIDTDGYLFDNVYQITQKSKTLSNDIAYLARSLGFGCTIKRVTKKWDCTTKGKHYIGQDEYYNINIFGTGINTIPCILKRKQASERKQIKNALVSGVTLTSLGIGDYYGFEIDGNKRFVLGDFTVTHNTTIANVIANEMGSEFKPLLSNAFAKKKDVQNLMASLNYENYASNGTILGPIKPTIVFLDEIHQLSKDVQECFFQAMEDNIFTIDKRNALNGTMTKSVHWLPRFTLIGATTKPGTLDKAFIERFKLVFTLNLYTNKELVEMSRKYIDTIGLRVTEDAMLGIAERSRGVARKMINFIERCKDTALAEGKKEIDIAIIDKTFKLLNIDKLGFEQIDLRVLTYLYKIYPQRIGLARLAGVLGVNDTIVKDIVEPYLLKQGFVDATPSGRMITVEGMAYCERNALVAVADEPAGAFRKVPNV